MSIANTIEEHPKILLGAFAAIIVVLLMSRAGSSNSAPSSNEAIAAQLASQKLAGDSQAKLTGIQADTVNKQTAAALGAVRSEVAGTVRQTALQAQSTNLANRLTAHTNNLGVQSQNLAIRTSAALQHFQISTAHAISDLATRLGYFAHIDDNRTTKHVADDAQTAVGKQSDNNLFGDIFGGVTSLFGLF